MTHHESGWPPAAPDERAWRRALAAELDNLRAATSWAFDAAGIEDVDVGIRVLDALLLEAFGQHSWGIQVWAYPALARIDELTIAQCSGRLPLAAARRYESLPATVSMR